jgi:hypothetical protein
VETGAGRGNPHLRRLGFLGNMGAFIFPVGAVALVSVPAVLAYQATQWLETGGWPPLTFADGLRWVGIAEPHFSSVTLEWTNATLLASPLSLVLLFGIGGSLFLYARFSKWLEKYCEPEKAEPSSVA